MQRWIGLLRLDKRVEHNARFVLGDKIAESLEYNKIYTMDELKNLNNSLTFITTSTQNKLSDKDKWRCVDINNGM